MTNYFILSPGDKIQKDDEYLNVDPAHLVWVSVEPRKVGKKASTYHMVRRPVPSNSELITWIHCCAADGKYIKGSEPQTGSIVVAQVKHWHTGGCRFVVLKRVKESDCTWRTVDDNSELSYDYNVIKYFHIKES